MNASSTLVEPAYCHVPPYDRTLGPEVADLARLASFGPDPEQELALDAVFGIRDGRSAAFEVGIAACRQNIKTGLLKQCGLGWLFITRERLIVWSAHEWDTVKEAFRDLEELITGSDYLRREVKNIYRGNGDEAIELMSGPRMIFKTRTKGGGRGLSGKKVVLDEAMFLQPSHMGSLLPTMSAQPDPQVLYGGSAGLAESAVWRGVRDRGRAGGEPRLAWIEYCSSPPEDACARGAACDHRLDMPGCGCDDPANWQRGNTSLGRRRANGTGLTVEYVKAERRAMPPAEFGRERMGWWDDPLDAREVIPLHLWAGCADRRSDPVPRVALAAVFSHDQSAAAVGLAGWRADGLLHVEVADYRRGTAWVAAWLIDRVAKHDPCAVVVDQSGYEGAVIPELEAARVEVIKPQARDVVAAFGQFYESVVDSRVLRHRAQADLDEALAGAVTRDVGDGGKAWGRRKSSADISPLVAVTLAAWGLRLKTAEGGGDPGAWLI